MCRDKWWAGWWAVLACGVTLLTVIAAAMQVHTRHGEPWSTHGVGSCPPKGLHLLPALPPRSLTGQGYCHPFCFDFNPAWGPVFAAQPRACSSVLAVFANTCVTQCPELA